jgi:hypothetical protein
MNYAVTAEQIVIERGRCNGACKEICRKSAARRAALENALPSDSSETFPSYFGRFFIQLGDASRKLRDPLRLVDLADRWRHLHIAYGGETRLPFPLHELGSLEAAIVGMPE